MAQSTTVPKGCCERGIPIGGDEHRGLPVIAVRIKGVISWGDLTTRQTSEQSWAGESSGRIADRDHRMG
jgi:hypothetical protein